MIRKTALIVSMFMFVSLLTSPVFAKKRSKVMTVDAGVPLERYGFAVDASYDPRLDNLVPGYRVINVAVVNNSFNIIRLDSAKDKWYVKMRGERKQVEALINLRDLDLEAWSQVPEAAKPLLSYPLAIPIGARLVIDIFVPEKVDLSSLSILGMHIAYLGQPVEVRLEK